MNIFTRDCGRNDCVVQENAPATRTLMSWTPSFDKRGVMVGAGDPNITTYSFVCRTCGAHWTEREQYGFVAVSHQ
jgi:hypothetical protein